MTRIVVFALCSALAAPCVLNVTAQQPPPATKPSAGSPGVIRGRITASENGRPLRRATVFLWPDTTQAGRPLLNVSTNTQGVFEIRDVSPGSYYVSANRAGYIELQHGQRRPRERGVAIEVRSGEARERVDIALPRGSVITGRVVDEQGLPYPDVTILALEMRYQLGERNYSPVAGARTDDLGHYRISGLQPGRYILTANATETWRNEKKETFGYPSTFYPNAQTPELAQGLTVGIAEERPNSDWMLAASRTAAVRGRVQRPTGEPLAGEQVGMNRLVGGGGMVVAGGLSTRTAADGTFEFRDVTPATYSIRAVSSGASASLRLPVTGADIDNVVLVPRTGSTLLATIVTETGEPPPFPASGVRVNLVAPAGADVLPTVRVPGVDNDWSVRMTSVGGPFVFRMVNLRDGWMLDAVRLGERDITDEPYDFPAGREFADLQFVLTTKVGTVNGSVVGADGKPTRDATVVLFAEDASLWTVASRFVRSSRPTADGRFSISGLPGGSYLAIAREFVADGEWESREFLEAARQDAVRLTLERGGMAAIELKVR
jgi:protocatechuate 3,4-dioxygenase beta subunit